MAIDAARPATRSTTYVLGSSHRFEVRWVDARAVAADVIYLIFGGRQAVRIDVSPDVRSVGYPRANYDAGVAPRWVDEAGMLDAIVHTSSIANESPIRDVDMVAVVLRPAATVRH